MPLEHVVVVLLYIGIAGTNDEAVEEVSPVCGSYYSMAGCFNCDIYNFQLKPQKTEIIPSTPYKCSVEFIPLRQSSTSISAFSMRLLIYPNPNIPAELKFLKGYFINIMQFEKNDSIPVCTFSLDLRNSPLDSFTLFHLQYDAESNSQKVLSAIGVVVPKYCILQNRTTNLKVYTLPHAGKFFSMTLSPNFTNIAIINNGTYYSEVEKCLKQNFFKLSLIAMIVLAFTMSCIFVFLCQVIFYRIRSPPVPPSLSISALPTNITILRDICNGSDVEEWKLVTDSDDFEEEFSESSESQEDYNERDKLSVQISQGSESYA